VDSDGYPSIRATALLNARGEAVGINTQKLVKKNVNGIGFALSATDLLAVPRRFYPNVYTDEDRVAEKLSAAPKAGEPAGASGNAGNGTVVMRNPSGRRSAWTD
jgi:S1-C subfamily serine protease